MIDRGVLGSLNDMDDNALLRRFKEGSEDAATAIYLRYAKQLQRLATEKTDRRHKVQIDAESIVQSVFRTFFRRAETGQYAVEDTDSLWKLLLVMAMNKIRSKATFLNAAKRDQRKNISIELIADFPQSTDGKNDEALKILQLTIEEFLREFPKSSQSIIMARIDGHTIDEIAVKTGRSKRTIERVLQNFRALLEQHLEEV